MASSLRAATGELRTRTVASMASQVGRYARVTSVTERTPHDAPLLFVDLAGVVRVQDFEGLLQPRRVEEELQIFLAARRKEPDDFLIRLDGLHDLGLGQRSAAVLVDELEALPGGGKELAGKFRNLLLRRLRLRLAGRGALLELVLQRDLDARLPGWNIDR